MFHSDSGQVSGKKLILFEVHIRKLEKVYILEAF